MGVRREEPEQVLDDCRGWPGTAPARRLVSFADARAESALESVGRWRMHEAALPAPELQVLLHDDDGPIGRTDFCWPALPTVGEADGFGKYRAPDGTADFSALRSEKLREDRLRDAGLGGVPLHVGRGRAPARGPRAARTACLRPRSRPPSTRSGPQPRPEPQRDGRR